MSDISSFTCTGRLTRDAETKLVGAKNTLSCTFSIAVNTGYGQYAVTSFYNVQIWGQRGASIAEYLKKGKQIAVTGPLENKKYTGRDGQSHDNWTITANDITLLADSKNSSGISHDIPVDAEEDGDPVF